ncbi:MAG: ABC transporter substrate-binding protein [Solirubrobacterales bacterium]
MRSGARGSNTWKPGVIAALVLILLGLLMSACGSSGGGETSSAETGSSEEASSGEPIVVGAPIALTGWNAAYDGPPWAAFKLAAEKVNEEGGINGRELTFIERDMRSDTAQAASTANSVIDEGAELLLVPCDPDLGAPGALVGQERGVLTFSLCEASTKAVGPQAIGGLTYTPSQAAYLEGYVMAEFGMEKKNADTAFVIQDTEGTYNLDVCKGFENHYPDIGGEIVGLDKVKNEDKSIPSTITNIKNANPDAIFICSFPPGAASWIRQIRAAGLDQPILSDMAMDGTYWLNAVPNLSEFFYPSAASIFGDDPNPKVNEFVEAFTEAEGERPETAYALFGASILELFETAVERAGGTTEGQALADELDQFSEVPTLVGATTYTPDFHIVLDRPMLIMQIQNGKPSYLETWEVEKAPGLSG